MLNRRTLWIAGLGGVALLGVALASSKSEAPSTTPTVPPVAPKPTVFGRVVLIGDSHAEGLSVPLGGLVVSGQRLFASDFKRGSGAYYWLSRFPVTKTALSIGPNDVIVVSLGGNDYKNVAAPSLIKQLAAAMLATGARVVWLEPTRFPFTDTAGIVDAWRASISEVFPTHLIDATLVRGPDGIHLVPSSYRTFAQAIWSYLAG